MEQCSEGEAEFDALTTEASWSPRIVVFAKKAKGDIFIEENNTVRKGFAPVV